MKSYHCILLIITAFACTLSASADEWDRNNYAPSDKSVKIGHTNLPIVFIDTRNGGKHANIIHKDYRIPARMKIVSNADGINYSDTVAHPGQHVDYEGWVGIKYRGNSSFDYSDKKPLGFKTLKTNDVDGKKDKVELLGMGKDNDWVMLAPFHDRSLIRDVLMFTLARPYFEYTPTMKYCEVVLDGIYYGIYIIGEKAGKGKYRLNLEEPGDSGDELTGDYHIEIDRNDEEHVYTSKYKGRNKNGSDLIINNKVYFQYKNPEYDDMMPDHPAQLQYLQHQIDAMEDAFNSRNYTNPNTGYRKYVDVQSFVDQFLSQEFCLNGDAYRLSTNLYKRRDSVDPRFKTTLWDFNLAFGNNLGESIYKDSWGIYNNVITGIASNNPIPFWWAKLIDDPAFVKQAKQRWYEYRLTSYTEDHIMQVIDSLTTMLQADGALQRNFKVWPTLNQDIWLTPAPPRNNTYAKEIQSLKDWIIDRMKWIDRQLGFDATGITRPQETVGKQVDGYYNLNGVRVSKPQGGPVIVRYKDGTSRLVCPPKQ